jgi:hypothetical protein
MLWIFVYFELAYIGGDGCGDYLQMYTFFPAVGFSNDVEHHSKSSLRLNWLVFLNISCIEALIRGTAHFSPSISYELV